jgi:prophage antirepressor-like protein
MNRLLKRVRKTASYTPRDEEDAAKMGCEEFLESDYKQMLEEMNRVSAEITEARIAAHCKDVATIFSREYDYLDYDKIYNGLYTALRKRFRNVVEK